MLVLGSGTPGEAVSLDDIKEYVNVVGNEDDLALTTLRDSVVLDGEDFTNRQFGEATYELYIENLEDGLSLPKNPIQSIEKIELLDENSTYQVLDSSKYYLYEEYEIGKIKLLEDLEVIDHKKAVKITFICGYETVPEPIKMWIKYKIMCLFDAKEENINEYVENMLRKYRIGPLG